MSIKVSILIPIFRVEKYVEECLRSVFEQTYENIEYVLVNDATPDNSMQVVRDIIMKYPKRKQSVIVLENETNKGIAFTRNRLLQNASGDFIYFVDSDDFIEKETVEKFVDAVQNSDVDIVRCNHFRYDQGKITTILRTPLKEGEDLLTHCLASENAMTFLPLLLIRRSLFVDNDISFPEDVKACEDFLISVKLFYYTKKLADIPDALYYYRMENTQSITHNEKMFKINACRSFEKIEEFLKEKGIYEQYKEYLLRQMFTCKQSFLVSKSSRDINRYISTFPESSKCYKSFNYSKKQNLLFYLAEHKHILLLKLLCKIA